LQLNDKQRQKIQSILEESQKQREALANKYKIAERDAYKKDLKSLHEKKQEQIKGVLTPAQLTALETMKQHHGKRGEHHGKRWHRGDCGPEHNGKRGHHHHAPAERPAEPAKTGA